MKNEYLAMLALWNDSTSPHLLSLPSANGKSGTPSQKIIQDQIQTAIDFIFEKNRTESTENPFINLLTRREMIRKTFISYLDIIDNYLSNKIRILTYWDDEYPERLREIPSPPYVLYVRGAVFPGQDPIAIVGTRGASKEGLDKTYHLAMDIAERGRTVISGLALGVDTKAHEGALDGNGETIAVLAGDVHRIYPSENADLAKRIMERGSLVSEMTRNAGIMRSHFVSRNRITSGLSDYVIVGEAGKAGGTVHQAKFALAQKRPLFILHKENFDNPDLKDGYQRLVKMGAIPIHTADDIFHQVVQSRLG